MKDPYSQADVGWLLSPTELRNQSRDQIGDLWFESTSRLEGLSETEKKLV